MTRGKDFPKKFFDSEKVNELSSLNEIATSRFHSPEHYSESLNRRTCWQEKSPSSSTRVAASVYSARQKGYTTNYLPASVNNKQHSFTSFDSKILLNDGLSGILSEEQEQIRFSQVGRKKDFVYFENINGKPTNVLKGLELHTGIFNAEEQKKIVECVYNFQHMGRKGQLRERTYSEPRKWMRGKGRVTIQFGCCYNYAVDRDGNPPGIIRDEEVDPLPHLFKQMIKRMVRWHILPTKCVPNSCIINIYDEGDCIPPHIDHHDFLRPFCTVSFLTECNILFGSTLEIVDAGVFSGPAFIPLPVGSVLILNGNGADIAKHCVPSVPAKRISITFRKMDDSKLPYKFSLDPELLGIEPIVFSPPLTKPLLQQNQRHNQHRSDKPAKDASETVNSMSRNSFRVQKDDFPPNGSSNNLNQPRFNGDRSKEERAKERENRGRRGERQKRRRRTEEREEKRGRGGERRDERRAEGERSRIEAEEERGRRGNEEQRREKRREAEEEKENRGERRRERQRRRRRAEEREEERGRGGERRDERRAEEERSRIEAEEERRRRGKREQRREKKREAEEEGEKMRGAEEERSRC